MSLEDRRTPDRAVAKEVSLPQDSCVRHSLAIAVPRFETLAPTQDGAVEKQFIQGVVRGTNFGEIIIPGLAQVVKQRVASLLQTHDAPFDKDRLAALAEEERAKRDAIDDRIVARARELDEFGVTENSREYNDAGDANYSRIEPLTGAELYIFRTTNLPGGKKQITTITVDLTKLSQADPTFVRDRFLDIHASQAYHTALTKAAEALDFHTKSEQKTLPEFLLIEKSEDDTKGEESIRHFMQHLATLDRPHRNRQDTIRAEFQKPRSFLEHMVDCPSTSAEQKGRYERMKRVIGEIDLNLTFFPEPDVSILIEPANFTKDTLFKRRKRIQTTQQFAELIDIQQNEPDSDVWQTMEDRTPTLYQALAFYHQPYIIDRLVHDLNRENAFSLLPLADIRKILFKRRTDIPRNLPQDPQMQDALLFILIADAQKRLREQTALQAFNEPRIAHFDTLITSLKETSDRNNRSSLIQLEAVQQDEALMDSFLQSRGISQETVTSLFRSVQGELESEKKEKFHFLFNALILGKENKINVHSPMFLAFFNKYYYHNMSDTTLVRLHRALDEKAA